MLVHLPSVLDPTGCAQVQDALHQAWQEGGWVDGASTGGADARRVKHNHQLPTHHPLHAACAERVGSALLQHPLFATAALPRTLLPALFNAHGPGAGYGLHVDNALRLHPRGDRRVRCDLAVTVFLSDPDDYDGGELAIHDTYGIHDVKGAAGDAVLYPATSLHQVNPVTRGLRLAAIFWIESLVADVQRRALLFDLDSAIIRLRHRGVDGPELRDLTHIYHRLLQCSVQT